MGAGSICTLVCVAVHMLIGYVCDQSSQMCRIHHYYTSVTNVIRCAGYINSVVRADRMRTYDINDNAGRSDPQYTYDTSR